jgi:hypothetical protein
MTQLPLGHTSVRAQKRSKKDRGDNPPPWRVHELFPTPPWATRALFEYVLPQIDVCGPIPCIWEPAAGLRHMADVCEEYADLVVASDIEIYPGRAFDVRKVDFVDGTVIPSEPFNWIVTNPPFALAVDFYERALRHFDMGAGGLAMLLRANWLEGGDRYERVFDHVPPTLFAPFSERVPMCEGGYDPRLSTATSYAWFVWRFKKGEAVRLIDNIDLFPTFVIPLDCRERFVKPHDARLASRHVPGWVPPSRLKKSGAGQGDFSFDEGRKS